MTWQAWLTLSTVVAALGVMASDRVSPDKTMVGAVAFLVLTGALAPVRAVAGLSNEGMLTVALLFVIAASLRRSGAAAMLLSRVLGAPRSILAAQLRLMVPVATVSAFVNNTPLVAMVLPEVRDWCRRCRIPPSRILMLLSFAVILGGVCTLIGTSTNLVVDAMLRELGEESLGLFQVSRLGVPVALAGLVTLAVLGRLLLPDRAYGDMPLADPRAFTAEFIVEEGGPLDGARLGDVAVPDLPGLHPIEIERARGSVPVPREDEVLRAGDRLILAAGAAEILAIRRFAGLQPAGEQTFVRDPAKRSRVLVELVVSGHCPLVGTMVGDGSFRRHYDAAVIAVARHGERVARRVGGWKLEAGDTILVEASPDFIALHRMNPDFYFVSSHGVAVVAPGWHRGVSAVVFVGIVVLAATGAVGRFEAFLGGALLFLASGIISWNDAKDDVNWRVLLTIAMSLGLGAALQDSGAAAGVAEGLVALGGPRPWLALALVHLATVVTTQVVQANAAAALNLPIALATAAHLGVSHLPFAMVVLIGASASFATPVGYQTNLMVYGPGGYRFSDFLRLGLPLLVVVSTTTIALAPLVFPF